MEQEYIVTIKNKNIEAKHATEAAQKLQQSVDELQVASQKKDDEIARLQAEVTKAKEKMLILEDELTQMHSLVKGKDTKTHRNKDVQLQSCQKLKKNIDETNKKSKSEGPVSTERSRSSQVTPDRRYVKTSRTRVSETSQKRKRGSALSNASQRCSIRVLQVKAAVPPVLLPPSFTVPKLKTPSLMRSLAA